jgi:chloride channel 7
VVNSGNVKLANSDAIPYLDSMVAAILLGGMGGLLGAMFVIINNKVNFYRKKILKQKWMKVVEAVVVVAITVSIFFISAYLSNECT